jgi:hypothetical protein
MKKNGSARTQPSQHDVNCLAAFIEAAEELEHEPFFGPDNQGSLISQNGQLVANFGDRFHFRSALITFRRIWMNDEASNFGSICNLIQRYERNALMVEIARDQFKMHTSMKWGGLPINAGAVVDLWLNGVFAHVSLKSKQWRNRIDFEKLLKSYGHVSLEFICRNTVSAVGVAFLNLLKAARFTLKRWEQDYGLKPEFEIGAPFGRAQVEVSADGHLMIRQPSTEHFPNETPDQRFNRILSRSQFEKLNSILRNASDEGAPVREIVMSSDSYEDLLAKLGNAIVVEESVESNDYYSKGGVSGGVRAVLPLHDVWTNTTFPTVITLDKKVITTKETLCVLGKQLADFKRLLAPAQAS